MKLSARLQQIADQIPAGSRLADIGSDHALLPVSTVQSGIVISAIAGEVNPGPFQAAQKQVAEAGLSEVISVRKGNGLEVIEPGEVDVITIAGMGGSLIVRILTEGSEKLEGVSRLVLQPNIGEDVVRRWLVREGWYLVEEHILEEDGKIYEILTAERVQNASERNEQLYAERELQGCGIGLSKEMLISMGPYLVEKTNAAFFKKWQGEIAKLERIRKSLSESELEASKQKEKAIASEIEQIKEVLKCLQKGRP
ncbi:tRNA (adenine(22)-N(1))-methyltransferase TrmK [Paenibacillus sediminis]|uniref:tRNA (Adenine22-N1)-methyltransferase n=1 Tax=Paenibacillus sediminis TaxID=664909 RepID=A0ABS4GYS7_9BACL|nr:tRNA (adenine(22)-N(1))-methyltransferase TrmK [Paenibacillus sediminis]MBP1935414.1 tRNA (adenine22-N1)-methyltransferase [Paenibacillus sediminis]